jgi:plasmid stability protein
MKTIPISDELHQQLKIRAAEDNTTINKLAENIFKDFLQNKKTPKK